jgi:hypothetical protein
MHLLIGKLPLLDYRDSALGYHHPEANTFELTARELNGVDAFGTEQPVEVRSHTLHLSLTDTPLFVRPA